MQRASGEARCSDMTAGEMIDEYMYWILYFYPAVSYVKATLYSSNDYKPVFES